MKLLSPNLNRDRIRSNIKNTDPITTVESLQALVDGYGRFQERDMPSTLRGVSFLRVAGQAHALSSSSARKEISDMLLKIKRHGVFLVLGHGGDMECGAVKAKKASLSLPAGNTLNEPKSVLDLVSEVSDGVLDKSTPHSELINSIDQATRILNDPEFSKIIKDKNLTVVASVCDPKCHYVVLNRTDSFNLAERHPKLPALDIQMQKAVKKIQGEGIILQNHYAHSVFVYDPLVMASVLDPSEKLLDVGGICCVDARLQPNTPGGPKFLFRAAPNQIFAVTGKETSEGVELSPGAKGSIVYSMRHVKGLKADGHAHLVYLTTDVNFANKDRILSSLLSDPDIAKHTKDGKTISFAAFGKVSDYRVLKLLNTTLGIYEEFEYNPNIEILEA